MTNKEIESYTNEELLAKQKQFKKYAVGNALLIGVFIGVAIYSAVKNGVGFATVFPLIFVYFMVKNSKKSKAIDDAIKNRGLK
mgnify:FL=1